MSKFYYVYILTTQNNTVLYTGITSDLKKRVYEHKNKLIKGFTYKYNVNKLVYYAECSDVYSALGQGKKIKSWTRRQKVELIENINKTWNDLYDYL